ncbi:MAG: GGDEF domain-containing protein [Lachnospiraceae bacterium]|nr:GGDEF domain-containing protein [Lachnospiraceae bacterium]
MEYPSRQELPLVKISKPLCVLAFLFVLGTVLWCIIFANNERTKFSAAQEIANLSAYQDRAQAIKVPASFDGRAGEAEIFYTTLPDYITPDSTLMLQSEYCSTEVYAGDELLGSYGTKLPLPFGEMIGNIRVLVRIPAEYAGRQLTIKYTPYYSTATDYPELSYAAIGTLQLYVLLLNMPRVVICLILLTMALAAFCMSIFEFFGGSKEIMKMLLFFILFVLCVLTWIICSSDLPQFFTSNNETVSLMSFLALSILPIPFSGFCALILQKGKTAFAINSRLGWFLPVTVSLCFVTDLCDPYYLLIPTHLYIAFTLLLAIACALRQWREDKGVAILAASLILLFLFALIGLILFYISKTGGYDALFFGAGLALFILMLFALILNRQMGYYEQKKAAEIYKEMAYHDFLTQIPNRTAFESRVEELLADDTEHAVTLFVLDLNDLKKINDHYGHQDGDTAITAVADCLKKTFEEKGDYFRVGGDEFTAIVLDHAAEPASCIGDFRKYVEEYNKTAEHEIRVAIGHAEGEQLSDRSSFRILFANADQEMYRDKVRLKDMM